MANNINGFGSQNTWFITLAVAALEIYGFPEEKEAKNPGERLGRIKEVIKTVIIGQNRFVDTAFEPAKELAILSASTKNS